jgi:hypothetical protein
MKRPRDQIGDIVNRIGAAGAASLRSAISHRACDGARSRRAEASSATGSDTMGAMRATVGGMRG